MSRYKFGSVSILVKWDITNLDQYQFLKKYTVQFLYPYQLSDPVQKFVSVSFSKVIRYKILDRSIFQKWYGTKIWIGPYFKSDPVQKFGSVHFSKVIRYKILDRSIFRKWYGTKFCTGSVQADPVQFGSVRSRSENYVRISISLNKRKVAPLTRSKFLP